MNERINVMIQDVIVLSIVFATVVYVLNNIIGSFKRKRSCKCDNCDGCGFKELVKDKKITNLRIVSQSPEAPT